MGYSYAVKLENKDSSAKCWLLDVMRCVDRLGKPEFTLQEMCAFENELSYTYPSNKHIRNKSRQQLQLLRDKEYIEFVGRGSAYLTRRISASIGSSY